MLPCQNREKSEQADQTPEIQPHHHLGYTLLNNNDNKLFSQLARRRIAPKTRRNALPPERTLQTQTTAINTQCSRTRRTQKIEEIKTIH